jgi:hypothetical protein
MHTSLNEVCRTLQLCLSDKRVKLGTAALSFATLLGAPFVPAHLVMSLGLVNPCDLLATAVPLCSSWLVVHRMVTYHNTALRRIVPDAEPLLYQIITSVCIIAIWFTLWLSVRAAHGVADLFLIAFSVLFNLFLHTLYSTLAMRRAAIVIAIESGLFLVVIWIMLVQSTAHFAMHESWVTSGLAAAVALYHVIYLCEIAFDLHAHGEQPATRCTGKS